MPKLSGDVLGRRLINCSGDEEVSGKNETPALISHPLLPPSSCPETSSTSITDSAHCPDSHSAHLESTEEGEGPQLEPNAKAFEERWLKCEALAVKKPLTTLAPIEFMDFPGPTYHVTEGKWPKSYEMFDDGSVSGGMEDHLFLELGDHNYEKSRKVLAALRAITPAAGRIFVSICRCRSPWEPEPRTHNGILVSHDMARHQVISLSGFWLEGYKFVTTIPFLRLNEELTEAQKNDTMNFLLYSDTAEAMSPTDTRARVSCESISEATEYEQRLSMEKVPQIYNVQLTNYDEAADVAIFKPVEWETRRPRTWIMNSQLSSAAAEYPDEINSKLFSFYYPGYDTDFNQLQDVSRVQKGIQEKCRSTFELMVKERMDKARRFDDRWNGIEAPLFRDIFRPTRRSIAFGHIAGSGPWMAPNQNAGAIVRTHNITGFHCCSGAMVGYFERVREISSPDLIVPGISVKILGVFKGQQDVYNTFTAFTQKGIDAIVNS